MILHQRIKEAEHELATLNDVIRWAVSRFNEAEIFLGHGTDNMWDEAIALVLPSLHLNYDLPDLAWQARLTRSEVTALIAAVVRRINERIPTAYLTHSARFAGLNFYVDQRVLVPRSPIAELIEKRFAPWLVAEQATDILDLCTGSGCIAVAAAHYFPEAQVDAVDICQKALEVAVLNVEKHQLQERVHLYSGDLFSALPKENQQYDLIISNPPYVDTEDMRALPTEYTHEPMLGLAGGSDGLVVVKKILAAAKNYLKPGGLLVIEVGNSEQALLSAYPEVPFIWVDFERADGGVFILTQEQLTQTF
jgi:ribosomal protein L3 glutamine methyltransferase